MTHLLAEQLQDLILVWHCIRHTGGPKRKHAHSNHPVRGLFVSLRSS